jgi:hypothetical protein
MASKRTPTKVKSATQALNEFLEKNNIDLTIDPIQKTIKFVSDGSIIVEKPSFKATYG